MVRRIRSHRFKRRRNSGGRKLPTALLYQE
jgi:hypothetical protein